MAPPSMTRASMPVFSSSPSEFAKPSTAFIPTALSEREQEDDDVDERNDPFELSETALKLSQVIEREARRRTALRRDNVVRVRPRSAFPSFRKMSKPRGNSSPDTSVRKLSAITPTPEVIPEDQAPQPPPLVKDTIPNAPPAILTQQASRRRSLQQNSSSTDDDEVLTLMQRLCAFFDDPQSSVAAYYFSVFIFFFITLSTCVFIAQTERSLDVYARELEYVETICAVVFTIEFSMRFLCSPSKLKFLRCTSHCIVNHQLIFHVAFSNWIDLAAIFPYYLETILQVENAGSFAAIRIVRLTRVARVLKMSRYSSAIQVFVQAIAISIKALSMLVFLMGIAMIVLSSAIYFAEFTADGCRNGEWTPICKQNPHSPDCICLNPNPYKSIASSFWWCIVTMSTVGYGDMVPVTMAGKIVGSMSILTGMLVLALPITVIGTNFQKVMKSVVHQTMNSNVEYLKGKRQLCRDEIQAILQRFHAVTEDIHLDIDDVINVYDTDNSGMLEDEELARFRRDLEVLQHRTFVSQHVNPAVSINPSNGLHPMSQKRKPKTSSKRQIHPIVSKSASTTTLTVPNAAMLLAHQSTAPSLPVTNAPVPADDRKLLSTPALSLSTTVHGPSAASCAPVNEEDDRTSSSSSITRAPTPSTSPPTLSPQSSGLLGYGSNLVDEEYFLCRLLELQRHWEERLVETEQRLQSKLNNLTKIMIRVEELLERTDD